MDAFEDHEDHEREEAYAAGKSLHVAWLDYPNGVLTRYVGYNQGYDNGFDQGESFDGGGDW